MLTYGNPPLHSPDEFADIHRSGWSWVMQYIDRLVVPDTGNETLLDVYLDTSFVAGKSRPAYTRPWVGFCHHVWRKAGPTSMTHDLMLSDEFKQSLPHCKGLIAFTERQAIFWRSAFAEARLHIPVAALTHPTELDVPQWNIQNYIDNPDKQLIQVGAWMRDPLSLYRLAVLIPPGIRTSVLKGPNMEDVHAPDTFIEKFKDFLEQFETSGGGGVCRPTPTTQSNNGANNASNKHPR